MCSVENKTYTLSDKNPLEDFLNICEEVRSGREPRTQGPSFNTFPMEGIFYRGEPEIFKESLLIPKIFRKKNLDVEEAGLISDFKTTFPEHEKSLSSDIDWLSFMQHQGVPTRLLDWSTDPLVALYFALGQDPYDLEEQGVVYIVPIRNRIKFGPYESPIRLTVRSYSNLYSKLAQAGLFDEIKRLKEQSIPPEYQQQGAQLDIQNHVINGVYINSNGKKKELTNEQHYRDAVEVFPPNSHARIRAQSGVFTVHYGKYLNQQKILCDDLEHRQSFLVKESYKIIIPNKVKPMLKKKLEVLGLSEFKLFPEEDKFYNHFRKKKIQPLAFVELMTESIKPITDPKEIRNILLKIDDHSLYPGITKVPIPHIIKQFKLFGIERIIDEIFEKFFCSSFKETNLFIFSHLYKALEEFCNENKANQKLVLQQLVKLERKTKLLSRLLKKLDLNRTPDLYFDLKDNLFHKALKLLEKKPTTCPFDSVEVNQENTETTPEKI